MAGFCKKYLVFFFFILTFTINCNENLLNKSDNILWEFSFKNFAKEDTSWIINDLDIVNIETGIRLREAGEGIYGTMEHSFPYDLTKKNGYPFIQIKTGEIEHSKNGLELFVKTIEDGIVFHGELFTGLTTIDLRNCNLKTPTGTLSLLIRQKGIKSDNAGGWADLIEMKMVRTPLNGLIVEFEQDKNADGVVEAGDTLRIVYYNDDPKKEKYYPVKFYMLNPNQRLFPINIDGKGVIKLTDDGQNGDRNKGDGVFEKLVNITRDSNRIIQKGSMQPDKIVAILVYCESETPDSYFYPNLEFVLDTEKQVSVDSKVVGLTPRSQRYRTLWFERTQGENLALGKTVRFSPKPNYLLTRKNNTDLIDLTDGKLSCKGDDHIWFASDAVGWKFCSQGARIILDLDEPKPIKKVVLRLLGGKKFLSFPANVQVIGSIDGKNYYNIGSIRKLSEIEKDRSGTKGEFYLSENGNPYVYPFEIPINTTCQYLGFKIIGDTGFIYIDEVAVIKGNFEPDILDITKRQTETFIADGVVFRPFKDTLYISTNVLTPNFFSVLDSRNEKAQKEQIEYILELPEYLQLMASNGKKIKSSPSSNLNKGIAYSFTNPSRKNEIIGPFFIKVFEDFKATPDVYAIFTARSKSSKAISLHIPIKTIEIPHVPKLKNTHISLSWLSSYAAFTWPEHFDTWEHLGFNAVSAFPRRWGKDRIQINKDILYEARRRGFEVILNESPFHIMEAKCIRRKETEIYSQLADGTNTKNHCPSYRGKYYQKEIERVADNYELVRPDYVWYDIECFHPGAKEARFCTRCLEKQKKSGMPMNEFLLEMGKEMYYDMYNAIKMRSEKLNLPLPIFGSYDLDSSKQPIYQDTFSFYKIWPVALQQAQPSLYVIGNAQRVHDVVLDNWKNLRRREMLIPFLTAGTYGEYASHKLEHMILEALLNGAGGITYFTSWDFDTPLDFYYHAHALSMIAPYEYILKYGGVIPVKASNDKLTYSAMKNRTGEILLLVGNYTNTPNCETVVEMPLDNVIKVKNLVTNETVLPSKKLNLRIEPDSIGLYYISGKE